VWDSSRLALGTTMRQLLAPCMKNQPWTHFGMNLALGYAADRVALARDFMFLPDQMHNQFAAARKADGVSLVATERHLPAAPFPALKYAPGLFGRPWLVLTLVAALGLLCMRYRRAERIFDALFWLVLGLSGLILALLWFATDHSATKTNLNLLWALPTHLLVFWRSHRGGWVRTYFTIAGALASLTLLCWAIIPQEMPVEAMPLVALAAVKGLWPVFRAKFLQKTI
jgi:hypothetical protein